MRSWGLAIDFVRGDRASSAPLPTGLLRRLLAQEPALLPISSTGAYDLVAISAALTCRPDTTLATATLPSSPRRAAQSAEHVLT